jgi:hypothetical protein
VGARRSIDGNSERAYRVVKVHDGDTSYMGPYSTLGAAKGVRTREQSYAERRWPSMEIHIEQTPEGWEKVEA